MSLGSLLASCSGFHPTPQPGQGALFLVPTNASLSTRRGRDPLASLNPLEGCSQHYSHSQVKAPGAVLWAEQQGPQGRREPAGRPGGSVASG